MLEREIINDYEYILARLQRGYQESLDNLINKILVYKYNLECYYTDSKQYYDDGLQQYVYC